VPSRIVLPASGSGSHDPNELMPLVYDQLRVLARGYLREAAFDYCLQPTVLVHEAYLKLVHRENSYWRGRTHFLAVGAIAMRQILVDYARNRRRQKRWGGCIRLDLGEGATLSTRRSDNVIALDDALNKLAVKHAQKAHIVELRFFGGLNVQEVAELLGCSKRKVEQDWTFIRAWLRRELSCDHEDT
jgi:RNA polymerase sigma-70 factor (ECF subfamily)